MNVASCSTLVPACTPVAPSASCAPLRFDPQDPCWAGAFDRVTFEGDADPLGWLSVRSWLWSPLRDAVAALRQSVRERYAVDPTFWFDVEWSFDGSPPRPVLTVCAPVFPYVYPGYDPEVSDTEVGFILGEDGHPRGHVAAVEAVEHAVFDGVEVLGVHVHARFMAEEGEPAALPDVRPVKLLGPTVESEAFEEAVAGMPDLAEEARDLTAAAIQREQQDDLDRLMRGGGSRGGGDAG